MAAGTVVSRLSGYVRSMLLVAALGVLLHGDLFSIANTLPNMVYILVAGGVFNAVLVPQLVRAMKEDPDGGDAYASRVITLSALFLAAVTLVLVVAAPALLRLYLHPGYFEPARAAHLESMVDLTRWCLPQVFFYGMFVLVGQVLNARGRFGPMMWAPIANNLIAVVMLTAYLVLYGKATGAGKYAAYAPDQEVLLGLGSTLGIVAQLLILVPYLKAAGFHYRPRFDFRDPGLARTLRLGLWTVLFVVVNQVAYLVVVWLASGGTVHGGEGTGYTVYSSAFLLVMVPHSIVTVSLATAILPRISDQAHDGRLADLGHTLASTLRTCLVLVLPFAALLPVVAPDVANAMFGWGAGRDDVHLIVPSLAIFGPALVFFTVHYLMLRGFYALELTRRVFVIQCAIAATNVVVAVTLVSRAPAEHTSPALALAYLAAYAVGSLLSYGALRRLVGGLDTPVLVRFLVRMVVAVGLATLAAWAVTRGLAGLGDQPHPVVSAVRGGLAGTAALVVLVALARALRIREVTVLLDTLVGRLRRS
ncbi:murein biosynthesis integral membrane protein MurJ [Nocardioides gansuensis]|uniref:Murein biosynthesis integral membrane protein MurJ n=2 Tax=Nocardioides gansuensis TaxID=2138300 RepID=A0A2T8FGH8_9ACTN|nr:murein biosynthesis integral membrane protein MurJ [Nocardioides gansuensis]